MDRLGVKRPPVKTVMSSELDQMGVDESAAKELDMLNALLGHMGGGEGGSGKQSGGFTFQLDLFGKDSSRYECILVTWKTVHAPDDNLNTIDLQSSGSRTKNK